MSQPLSRMLKPLVYTNVLRNNNLVRWCSSTPIYPFMLIDHLLKVGGSSNGSNAISRRSGAEGENEIIIKSKFLAREVSDAMSIGLNQSGLNIHMKEKKFLRDMDNVRLNIYYKPSDPKSKSVSVRLPPLPKGSQIQNLAMSCLPDLENDDWVVAIKFSVSRLMLYRHKDLQWIDIETTHGHESICPYSSLMYSKKDQRFYTPTPGGQYLCSFGLNFKEKDEPTYDLICKKDLPQYMLYELEEMNSFTRTDHLVESPSGEQFLISWYYGDDFESDTVVHKTKRFLVFKEQEKVKRDKDMCYTENIGDLCIFLGHGEPMCVPASSSPGLKPNCIYFAGHNFGVFDITTQTITLFYTEEEGPLRSTAFPYWPHPFSLTPS
ncbi:hypothetical protein ISN44_As13g001840 [Arabidopsis suecica]|uniref:KIB1-4 beta-propeller domain-containing protein n=1 Tax=Arabidopsis suecica TaxID=45249 RepID=A0A8T1XYH4_ARASU|nr:hypothetical protein ISN44_As13g001840 [Arabidopsis suecica]